MRNDFCIFILTHRRPNRVRTLNLVRDRGYTGDVYLLVDDADPTLDEYRENFPDDQLVVFSKADIESEFDYGHNEEARRGPIFARNVSFDVAERLGYEYFMQLDDDYSSFKFRFNHRGEYGYWYVEDLDRVLEAMVEFVASSPVDTLCMAQGGDYIGGEKGSSRVGIKMLRKAMNTFICSTDQRFEFVGAMNDDVNTYVSWGQRGQLFMTYVPVRIAQKETQQQPGGLTEDYLELGTYTKSFYTVMYAPDAAKISTMGFKHPRIHHQIDWNATTPKILRERWRKDGDV